MNTFRIGQIVTHRTNGRGVITAIEGRTKVAVMDLAVGEPDPALVRAWEEAAERRAAGRFGFRPGRPVFTRDLVGAA